MYTIWYGEKLCDVIRDRFGKLRIVMFGEECNIEVSRYIVFFGRL